MKNQLRNQLGEGASMLLVVAVQGALQARCVEAWDYQQLLAVYGGDEEAACGQGAPVMTTRRLGGSKNSQRGRRALPRAG